MHFLSCQGKDFDEGLRPIEEENDEQDGEISRSSSGNLSGFTIVDILINVGAKVSSFLILVFSTLFQFHPQLQWHKFKLVVTPQCIWNFR